MNDNDTKLNGTLSDNFPTELKNTMTNETQNKRLKTRRQKDYLLEQARSLKAHGRTLKEIGEVLDVNPATICKWLKGRIQKPKATNKTNSSGGYRPRLKNRDKLFEQIRILKANGKTTREISKETKIAYGTIQTWFRRYPILQTPLAKKSFFARFLDLFR